MRHLKRNKKFGRHGQHRNAMLANLAMNVIQHRKITTTLAKAKATRPVVEKLVTLGKLNTVHARRLAAAKLRQQARTFFRGSPTQKGKVLREQWRENHDVVHILFDKIAPVFKTRPGGYTRIIKLGQRRGDSAQLAILEFVEITETVAPAATAETTGSKTAEAKA